MCDCQQTPGFKQKLATAKLLTEQTGETHVVYVRKAVGHVYLRKLSDIANAVGICCYFLPDGTEVEITPSVDDIEVNQAEVLKPKRAKKNAKVIQENTTETKDTTDGPTEADEPLPQV